MAGKDRVVRVVTLSQQGLDRGDPKTLVEATLERLEQAACCRPDIVCLPEKFSGGDTWETVPGPTTERLSRWAREHSCYVICPIGTTIGLCRFNSAVLLDRAGELVGRYDKIHPTEGELAQGVCPGANAAAFPTDFGPVGIQICFDVNWRDPWRGLKEQGAKIVFWPSAYPAHRQLTALAWMNEVYVVSATMGRSSRVYDITGEVIAQTGELQPWTVAHLHLGKRLFETDCMGPMRELQAKYGCRVLVQWYDDEDWFTLASLDPELSVDELMEEYGLVPLAAYRARCETAQDQARSRRAPGEAA